MKHASRTHGVTLGQSCDRTTLDPKNKIKDIDTQDELAEILMKSSLTRDELNHLFSFFNIMCIIMYIQKKTLPVQLKDPQTKSKTPIPEGKPGEEEREVAKSKRMWHFVSKIVDLFSQTLGSSIYTARWSSRSTMFKFRSFQHKETCIEKFEREQSIVFSSLATKCESEHQYRTFVAETPKNPVGTRFSHHNLKRLRKYACDKHLVGNQGTICLKSTSTL